MAITTLTSAITSINIEKLKKEYAAQGLNLVAVRPYNPPSQTEVDIDGVLVGPVLVLAQSIVDSHVDTQLENIEFRGKTEAIFGTIDVAGSTVKLRVGSEGWNVDSNRALLPTNGGNLGSPTNRPTTAYVGDIDASGDVIIDGNLTVNGTTTTINTSTLDVEDNEITVNSNVTGTPSLDGGLRNKRGTSTDAAITWNESTDQWEAGLVGSQEKIVLQSQLNDLDADLTAHINDFNNPHNTTKAQVGLGNVTDDAQLKRAAGDFNTFTSKASPVNADIFLIEDSADSFNKKKITLLSLNTNLDHQTLSGSGTNTHAQIDSHIANTSNPHNVTKAQVGLGNVTDDAQLKRAAADFDTFALVTPATNDLLLIEDASDALNKKKITISDLQTVIGAGVSSVFGRTGAVVAQSNDYTWAQIDKTTSSIADITNRSHTLLTDVGTYTHVQIDAHINNITNPHNVTKAQVGLGNVTDDAQLKRAAADYDTFTAKANSEAADIILIEDSSDSLNKKKLLIGNIRHADLTGVGTNTHAQIDNHLAATNNPHAVTKAQVGLGSVTDDAQLKRAANDFTSFASKSLPVSADVLLIEDSAASGAKKNITIGSIQHQSLSGVGSYTHAQIDTHIADTNNPHGVTKAQIGLANVTDDAQLKRAAGDFNTFTNKPTPVGGDVLLIEDSQDLYNKKKISLSDIPVTALSGAVDTSSNQNVGGIKTFTSGINIKTHSNYTGSELIERTFGYDTSNNTQQAAYTIAVPDNSVLRFKIELSCRYNNNAVQKAYWADIVGAVQRDGTNGTLLVGTPFKSEDENGSGYSATVEVNGNNLEVRVTGGSGETVSWIGSVRLQSVSTSA